MAIPNVIQTILKVTGMSQVQSAARQYNRILKGMADQTKKSSQQIGVATKDAAESFDNLIRSIASQNLFSSLRELNEIATDLEAAWRKVGQPEIDVALFEQLVSQGVSVKDAFQQAIPAVEETSGKINFLGVSVSQTALAFGALTTAVGIYVKLMKEAISEYTDFIEKVRILRLQLGLTTEEASGWIRALQLSGVTISTAERGLTSFAAKYGNLQLRLAEGKDVTNNFTRAMKLLDVSFEDATGNIRPMADILDDVNRRFQELGPGILTTTAAQDLFGFSGRFLLPVLLDQSTTLRELIELGKEFGGVTEEDRKEYEEWRKSTIKLQLVKAQLFNQMARSWIPTLTKLNEALANTVGWIVKLDAKVRAFTATLFEPGLSLFRLGEATEFYKNKLAELQGVQSDSADEERELAAARERQQEALARLAAEEDANSKEREKALERLIQLREDLGSRLLEIQIRSDQQVEDAFRRHWRRIEDIERRWNQRVADARTKFNRAREDAFIRESQRLRDLVDDRQRRISNLEEDFRFKREDLERKHRDKLEDIQTKFLDTVQEAARSNDAVAVVRAIRQRARDTRDAETKRGRDIRDLGIDLERRRKRINDDAKKREDAQKRRLQDELDRAKLQYERQLEDLRESLRRQREEAGIAFRRRLSDLNESFRRQTAAAFRWYKRQLDDLREALGLQGAEIDRAIRGWGTIAAAATVSAINTMGAAALAAQRAWARRILLSSSAGLGGTSGRTSGGWGGRRAEGGIDIVRRPTTFLAGEAGPEIAAFIPLRGSMNISHNFSRLGVDINGAGGMNTGQVESIVYAAMISLAQRLESKVIR